MPYKASDVLRREKILQVLLVAPPKSGKTVAAVTTLPGPVFVLNTDGMGALDHCAREGADFEAEDVSGIASLEKATAYFRANAKRFGSVVLDNITFLAEGVYRDVRAAVGRDDPRAIYPEVTRRCVDAVRALRGLNKHFVMIGQTDPGDANVAAAFGHMVSVSGKSKILLPAMVQDLLWLEASLDPQGKVRREFLLAPAGNWTKGARSVAGIPRMDANFTEFLRLANAQALPTRGASKSTQRPAQQKPGPQQKTTGKWRPTA